LLLAIILVSLSVIVSGDANIFECEPLEDCILYEFVTDDGSPCTNCTVNITILWPNGTQNQNGSFSYTGTPGNYRYNAGEFESAYYEAQIIGYDNESNQEFSNVNLIEVKSDREATGLFMVGSIVAFGLFLAVGVFFFAKGVKIVGVFSTLISLLMLVVAGRMALLLNEGAGLPFYRIAIGVLVVYVLGAFVHGAYLFFNWAMQSFNKKRLPRKYPQR